MTLASRLLGDSSGGLAGLGELYGCRGCLGCLGCLGPPSAFLPHSFSQTDSIAHWNSRAGGAAVKTNTQQLTGGPWAVFWGPPGPTTLSQPQCLPRKGKVGLVPLLPGSGPALLLVASSHRPAVLRWFLAGLPHSLSSDRLQFSPAKLAEKVF